MKYILPLLFMIIAQQSVYAADLPESITLWKGQASFFRSLDYSDEAKFKEKMKSYYAKIYGGEKYRSFVSWIDGGNLDSEYYSSFYDNFEDTTIKNIVRTGDNSFVVKAEQNSCYSLGYNPPIMESIVKDYKVTNMTQEEVDAWLNSSGLPTNEVCLVTKRSIKLTVDEQSKLLRDEKWTIESSTLDLHSR